MITVVYCTRESNPKHTEHIGFSRKYEKYLDVVSYIKNKEKLFWREEDIEFLVKNYDKIGGEKCALILNKTLTSIYNKIKYLKQKKKIW